VERLVAAHHACLPEPTVPATDEPAGDDPPDPAALLQWPDTTRVANTRQRYQQLHDLREQGLSMRAIARRLDLNFKTVRRYVRVASVDVLLAGGIQVSVLDPFKPYLNDRLADGERNATRLLAEITGQGYPGGDNTWPGACDRCAASTRPHSRSCRRARRRRRCGRSPAGSPASLATSTRTTRCGCTPSAPAAPSWTPPSGTWPGSPG
jgi:transposase-like protein